jgi:hypothetical protein
MSEELDVAPGEDITWMPAVSAAPAKPATSPRPEGRAGEPSTALGESAEKEPVPGGHGAGPQRPEAPKRQVLGLTGGVVVSQDGQVLRYRKKCLKCGYVDTGVATALIRHGTTRADFRCPKCRKTQPVEIRGHDEPANAPCDRRAAPVAQP